ncbi:hypothetical protein [Rhodoblastus sp.]|uniref:hypothetical protein n=1 Tax=Rhodoblastus sp. TaxID=1962975 RepID=UPI003F9D38D2
MPFAPTRGRAFVPHAEFVAQQCNDWCWAASCSMIFGTLGHPTDQKKLVDFLYSDMACAPAPQTRDLSRILDNSWVDDRGVPFRSRIEAAFDQENGISAIDDALIVGELMRKRPLLYANKDHCMVIVAADFIDTPSGPRIVGMGALDPSPNHSPYRALTEAERRPACSGGDMMYLAAVRI